MGIELDGWDYRPCAHCGKPEIHHNWKMQCIDETDRTHPKSLATKYKPMTFPVRLYRAIVGALFGPESHSKERYSQK